MVSDDGERLVLTLYAAADRVAAINLDPMVALSIAGALVEAMPRGACCGQPAPPDSPMEKQSKRSTAGSTPVSNNRASEQGNADRQKTHSPRIVMAARPARTSARGEEPDEFGELGDAKFAAYTSIAGWLARDIPDPDFLLGEVLSTTCRMMLVGPTGLGKTNFSMAVGAAIASGADFLHWRGSGKRVRVLIVEGEMSARLVKRRLADLARRTGAPATLHIVSRSDPHFANMPPLNTPAGQQVEPVGAGEEGLKSPRL